MDENTNDSYSSENNNGSETRNFSGQDSSASQSSNDSSSTGGTGGTGTGRTQEFKLNGEDIMGKIRELIEEGNARRIVVRKPDGSTMVEFPLTAGVIGAALLPVYAALGAVVALASNLTIVVEKRD